MRNPPLAHEPVSLRFIQNPIHPVLKRTSSLVVNAEDDASAEEGSILICVARVVVICVVPKALRCNAYTLTSDLADDALNDNLVTWNMALVFDLLSNGVDDLFRPMFGVRMIVLLFVKHTFDNRLNDILNL